MIDLATLGRRLKEARLNSGISQEEAADAIGVPRTAIVHIEAGNRLTSTVELAALANHYKRPVADFFKETEPSGASLPNGDALVAILRAAPEFVNDPAIQREITRNISICVEGYNLEHILGISRRAVLPEYGVTAPQTIMDAVEQGNSLAAAERRRLSIGDNRVPDMADLLTSQGIWASGALLPDEVSGLCVRHPSVGTVILVNYGHARARKRFSYAHEFCHALIDHSAEPKISSSSNRSELVEVRANAFAAAFLLPSGGVDAFLRSRDKGSGTRQEQLVYDGYETPSVRAQFRAAPWSQAITFQDVATLAHFFGASYSATAYRLRTLEKIGKDELDNLLKQQDNGRKFLRVVRLLEDLEGKDDLKQRDRELIGQVASLASEAYRRKLIDNQRLREVSKTIGMRSNDFLELAELSLSTATS